MKEVRIKIADKLSRVPMGYIMDAPEMVRPDHDADIHDLSIHFQDVSFSYDLKAPMPILDHINLIIKPGTMTALVGPSGSGKSTITKLITGFWEATSGVITLGGVDLKKIPLSQLSSYVSYVSQDNYLFDESIRENIRMGRLSATDQEVEDVARKCGCHGKVLFAYPRTEGQQDVPENLAAAKGTLPSPGNGAGIRAGTDCICSVGAEPGYRDE